MNLRSECTMVVRCREVCGSPSVYSEPCWCDKCDSDPGYHLPMHLCAEHYDQMMARRNQPPCEQGSLPSFEEEDL